VKIATWNINSINARLPNVLRWLEEQSPDVVLLQELKCMTDKFPEEEIKNAGYHCAVYGQKSWNGVAILSRYPIGDVLTGLPGDEGDEQARYIEATVRDLRVASLYLPNGNPVDTEKYPYKLGWMDRLNARAKTLLAQDMPVVLGGDYNIIPEDRDCHDPALWAEDALFRLESRKKFRALVYQGFTDAFRACNDDSQEYSFWDYQAGAWQQNNGIRIDHLLLSPRAADRLESCTIDRIPRGWEKASDHTPVIVELKA
jgi:exodeoxyribonuclease-3